MEEYYIQNGYVGNAILWWGQNHSGYTTDINLAGRYTKEEAEGIIKRPEDRAWPCSYIDENTECKKLIVDVQYLSNDMMLPGSLV